MTNSQRWLLAIDSSTDQAGIALFDGQRLAELSWIAGRTQTTSLLSEVDHLLKLQGVTLKDIAAIAVATGPGAFSGLRVGFGIAKGLSLARGIPLIGVPTLDATAYFWSIQESPVVAVVQAGRGRVVWAEYGHRWRSVASDHFTGERHASRAPCPLRGVWNGRDGDG